MANRKFKITALSACIVTALATAPATFAQDDDEELEEIIVTGIRSTLINSLAEKRNSDTIIDTLSSLQADRFPDRNVAEALQRLPGVSFVVEPATGLGEFISIRGLTTAYNNIQFDGVNGGSTSRDDRQVGLAAASADNVSEVRVSKAMLASDDSTGIGGSVNIITRTALDTQRDRFSFSAQGRFDEFTDDEGYEYKAGFTKLFGDDFGIDFSAAVDRRFVRNITINADNAELFRFPVAAFDQQQLYIDTGDRNFDDLFDNTVGIVSVTEVEMEDLEYISDDQIRDGLSLSGSLDWQATDATRFSLIGRFTERESTSLESFMEFNQADRCRASLNEYPDCIFRLIRFNLQPEIEDQINRHVTVLLKGETLRDRWTFDYYTSYALGREDQLDWELRFREGFGNSPTYGPFDSSNPGYAVPILSAEQIAIVLDPSPVLLNDTNIDILDTQEDERFAFGFDVDFDMSGGGFLESIQFGIKYETVEMTRWWNRAKTDRNAMRPDGTYDPDFGRFTTGDAGIYDSGFTVPLGDIGAPLAPFGINGIPQVDRAVYEAMRDNFKRTFLEALNAGLVDYQSKKFRFVEEDILNAYIQGRFKFSDTFQVIAGVRFDRMDGDYESTTSSAARVTVTALDGNSANEDLLEPVPFSPGVVIPQELVFVSRSETEILPRIVATWRPDDNWVVRGAYTTAIARPNVSRISRIPEENNAFTLVFEPPTLATIDPDATLSDILALGVTAADLDDFAVEIDVGNPALDNTFSHNFDLSVEYYFNDVSAITVGLFFKRIENFVFDPHEDDFTEGQFVTDPAVILADLNFTADGQALIDSVGGFSALLAPGTLELEIYQSENGRDADVFGIELGFATQFENLPAPWDGLGFFGNVTFLESEAETVFGTLGTDTGDTDWLILTGEANPGDAFVRKTDFFSQPDLIANAAIFYDKEGLEIALSYYYRGLQLHQLDDYGVDFWEQSTERWDFTFEYTLPWWEDTISVYFNARDFTDDGDKPTTHRTLGRGTRLPDILTFNGREFIFGISGRFGE